MLAFLLVSAIAAAEPVPISPEADAIEISPTVVVIRHKWPWANNSALVEVGHSHVVWVGSPYTTDATDAALAWAKKRFPKHTFIGIDTHFHFDGGPGAHATWKREGIEIIASDLTGSLLEQLGPRR